MKLITGIIVLFIFLIDFLQSLAAEALERKDLINSTDGTVNFGMPSYLKVILDNPLSLAILIIGIYFIISGKREIDREVKK